MRLGALNKHKTEFTKWFNQFSRVNDLPSIKQFCETHALMLNKIEPKFMRTMDKNTLNIAENILKKNEFLREHVLGDDGTLNKQKEIESIQGDIHPIKENPERLREYLEWKSRGKPRILVVEDPQSLISSIIPEISEKYDRF